MKPQSVGESRTWDISLKVRYANLYTVFIDMNFESFYQYILRRSKMTFFVHFACKLVFRTFEYMKRGS